MKGGGEMIIEGMVMFVEYLIVLVIIGIVLYKSFDEHPKYLLVYPAFFLIIYIIAISTTRFLIVAGISIVLLWWYLYKNWYPPIITLKRF